jgi:hypothetical protein
MPDARASLRPHRPTGHPFADTWYWYLHDPEVGYFKVAVVNYLNERTQPGAQHGYVHVAHAPVRGGRREYDAWYRHPVAIDEATITATLAEVSIEIAVAGPHQHYLDEPIRRRAPSSDPTPCPARRATGS